MSTILQELLKVTNQKDKGKKEDPTEFLVRIAKAVSNLEGDPDPYESLSAEAQAWYVQAAEALCKTPPAPAEIKPFSDFEREEKEPETKKDAKKTGSKKEEKVAAAAKKEKAAEAPKAAATKEKAPKGEKPLRETSVADTIRFAMCEDPNITKEGVAKVLKEKKMSFDPSRLDQVYSATARVLQILQQLKKLK